MLKSKLNVVMVAALFGGCVGVAAAGTDAFPQSADANARNTAPQVHSTYQQQAERAALAADSVFPQSAKHNMEQGEPQVHATYQQMHGGGVN
jgi:hypothetical protein